MLDYQYFCRLKEENRASPLLANKDRGTIRKTIMAYGQTKCIVKYCKELLNTYYYTDLRLWDYIVDKYD